MFEKDEILHFFAIPTFIGILGAFSAIVFRWLIKLFSKVLLCLFKFSIFNQFWILPLYFVLANYITRRVLQEHPIINLDAIAKKIIITKGGFSPVKGFLVLIFTSLNISLGLPVGREAPIAKLGALLGEIFLLKFHSNRLNWRIYMSAAVGAAISATFNAPLAGTFFGLEIILGRINLYILTPLIISSVVATVLAREFLGNFRAFYVPHLVYNNDIFFLLPIEIVFTVVTVLFLMYSLDFLKRLRIELRKKWYLLLVFNGFLVALLLHIVPEIGGVGYKYIEKLYTFHYGLFKVFVIYLFKLYAVILTLGSGLFGGLMSPSIFIGAFGGYFIGELFSLLVHGFDPRVAALVGSVAMLAGMSKAPLRSVIIITELTQAYQIFLPSLIAASLTSLLVARFEPAGYFRRSLIQKGVDIDNPKVLEVIKSLNFRDYLVKIPELRKNADITEAIGLFKNIQFRYLPIIDENGKLVGILSLLDLVKILQSPKDMRLEKIMSKSPLVLIEDGDLKEILRVLGAVSSDYVPLVDVENRYIGMVDLRKLFNDLSLKLYGE